MGNGLAFSSGKLTLLQIIQQVYNEQTAPGLTTQPNFLHYEAFLRPHFNLASNRLVLDYRFRYGFFQDTSGGHYSFRRFTSDFGHTFYPEKQDGHRRLDSILLMLLPRSVSRCHCAVRINSGVVWSLAARG